MSYICTVDQHGQASSTVLAAKNQADNYFITYNFDNITITAKDEMRVYLRKVALVAYHKID